MKKFLFSLIIAIIACTNLSIAQTDDDVYGEDNSTNHTQENQQLESKKQTSDAGYGDDDNQRRYDFDNTYSDDDYIDYDDDDYYYTSRIRRFHSSYWSFGYYSCFFLDPFWWDMSYVYPVYYNAWGNPGWGYCNYWSTGFSIGWSTGGCYGGWNNYGCYSGWNNYGCYGSNYGWGYYGGWNPYFGYGAGYNNGYYNGYNNGYYNGYWDGFYDGSGKGNYNYGPRTSSNSGSAIAYPRNSIRQENQNVQIKNDLRNSVRNTYTFQTLPKKDTRPNSSEINQNPTNRNQTSTIRSTETNVDIRMNEPIREVETSRSRPYQNQSEQINRQREIEQRQIERNKIREMNYEQDTRNSNEAVRNRQREQMNQQSNEREREYQNSRRESEQRLRLEREQRNQEVRSQRNREERIQPREERTYSSPRNETPRQQPRNEPSRMESPRMQTNPSSSPTMNPRRGR